MAAEIPQINTENYSQLLIENIFRSKKSIEMSTQSITKGSFADHYFRLNSQRIIIQALYGNKYRLDLIEPLGSILFEPAPYDDKLLELTSTTRFTKDLTPCSKTERYLVNKDCSSWLITPNGTQIPPTKPMGIVDFENASKLLERIQASLNNILAK